MYELITELWCSLRSTINKIEKGINDISYEKLLLLLKKYDISTNKFFEKNNGESLACASKDSNIFISFSARNFGNCYNIANYKMKGTDRYLAFGSEEETLLFIPTLLQLINGNKNNLLKIERDKYKLKLKYKVDR